MSKHEWVNDPEEWEKLTGSRGSVYISFGRPAKRPPKKSREVYLCPHCYELCTGSRPGVLRCDPCNKEWG
jgi:hypothetical protein